MNVVMNVATRIAMNVATNAAILACPALRGEHHPVRLFRKWQEISNAKRQCCAACPTGALFLPEGVHQLIVQGLDQIREHRPFAGLDEGFDWHSRRQLDVAEVSHFIGTYRYAYQEIVLAGPLVAAGICRDTRHRPLDLRRRPQIERREPQHDGFSELDLIDVLGIDLDLNHQLVALRHDEHERIAGGDHATDGIRRRFKYDSILRGAQFGALELILCRDLALDILADFAVGFAQLLGDAAGQILIDLDDLQLDFGDFAFRLRRLGHDLAALAFKVRFLALQRGQAIKLHQILLPQVAYAL